MKSASRALFAVWTVLALLSCKGTLTMTGDRGEEVLVGTNELSAQISYWNGGWWGPSPNYEAKLTMELINDHSVMGVLDTPNCKVEGLVDIQLYAKLDHLMSTSALSIDRTIDPADVAKEAAGDEYITRTSRQSESRDGEEEYLYLRKGDSTYGKQLFDSPEQVTIVVNEIIRNLRSHCKSVNDTYTSAEISFEDVNYSWEGDHLLSGDLVLSVEAEELKITGLIRKKTLSSTCEKEVIQAMGNIDIAEKLQDIELVDRESGCKSPNLSTHPAQRALLQSQSGTIRLRSQQSNYGLALLSCKDEKLSETYARNSHALIQALRSWIQKQDFTQANCIY